MKIKAKSFTREKDLPNIIKQKYNVCPSCGKDALYAGCIEQEFDEEKDNTNRAGNGEYWLTK